MTSTDSGNNLSEKHLRFCDEYMQDLNQTMAYMRVYPDCTYESAAVSACNLLKNPKIRARIEYLKAQASVKANVGYERTLRELGRLAFSNIADVVSFNAHSVTVKDSGELDDSVLAAIRKISFTERATDFGATTEVSVDMHAKEKALAQLCKFHGIGIGFEAIRAALKVYGFALIQDPESELGWKLEPYEPAGSSPDA